MKNTCFRYLDGLYIASNKWQIIFEIIKYLWKLCEYASDILTMIQGQMTGHVQLLNIYVVHICEGQIETILYAPQHLAVYSGPLEYYASTYVQIMCHIFQMIKQFICNSLYILYQYYIFLDIFAIICCHLCTFYCVHCSAMKTYFDVACYMFVQHELMIQYMKLKIIIMDYHIVPNKFIVIIILLYRFVIFDYVSMYDEQFVWFA
jgi:hypothetical protein